MSTEYESERPRAKPTDTLQEIRADGIRECIRMLRAVHVTTCTATAEKELDSLLSRLSTLQAAHDDLIGVYYEDVGLKAAQAEVAALTTKLEEMSQRGDSSDSPEASGAVKPSAAHSVGMGVPHLDRAGELLWQAGHPAIAEALQSEVEALQAQRDEAMSWDMGGVGARKLDEAEAQVAALQAELEAKQEANARLTTALERIESEWDPVSPEKIARAALAEGASETFVAWLIERGQPEGQSPPVWFVEALTYTSDYTWTETAAEATRFASKAYAEKRIAALLTPPLKPPTARAVEHGFIGGMEKCSECGALVGHHAPCSLASPELRAKWSLQAELEAKQEALRRIALIKPDLRPIKESDNFHRAEKAVSIARAALADAGGSATPPEHPYWSEVQEAFSPPAREAAREEGDET